MLCNRLIRRTHDSMQKWEQLIRSLQSNETTPQRNIFMVLMMQILVYRGIQGLTKAICSAYSQPHSVALQFEYQGKPHTNTIFTVWENKYSHQRVICDSYLHCFCMTSYLILLPHPSSVTHLYQFFFTNTDPVCLPMPTDKTLAPATIHLSGHPK